MELGTLLGILCLLITIFFFVNNFEKGMLCYIIFIFIAPHILDFSFELIAFPFMILACIIKKTGEKCLLRKLDFCDYSLIVYLFIGVLSTFISVLTNDCPANYIGLFGVFRVVIIGFVFRQFFAKSGTMKVEIIFKTILFVNIFACVVQLTIPQSVHFFYDLYYKSSMTPLKAVLELGYFNRLFGTFGTPISLAIMFDIIFTFYFYKWYTSEKVGIEYLMYLVAILGLGVFTYSKTLYFGIPIIIVSTIMISAMQHKKVKYKSKFFIMAICLVGLTIVLLYMSKSNPILQYYLGYFKNPLKIFETRYAEGGILDGVKEVVKNNILIGVGATNIAGEFVGDSAYYNILHYSGITGLAFYLLALAYCFRRSYKSRDVVGCVLIVVLLICGTASPTFTMVFASLVFGISGRRSMEKQEGFAFINEVI